MDRRRSLKGLAAASVGLLAIGYWAKDLDDVRDYFSKSFFKPTEQDAIMAIVDTIIPRGVQAYGAVDLGVPIYILDYLRACIEPDILANVRTQLVNIDSRANEKFGNDLNDCLPSERESLLLELSESEEEDERSFFEMMKKQTIHGFRNTEEVLTNHFDYKVVPGEYNGCYKVNEETTI